MKKTKALAIVLSLALFMAPTLAQKGSAPVKNDSKITYHNGPVMPGSANIYLIWYGNWNAPGNDGFTRSIIVDLLLNLGSTAYFNINVAYKDLNGLSPSGGLIFSGSATDEYSKGATLSALAIQSIVSDQIASLALPLDAAGIYVVLGSADIHSSVAGFCQPNGAPHHGAFLFNGAQVKYAFIGNPLRCPSVAAPHLTFPGPTPNDDFAGDGIANLLAAVLSATVTNPTGSGWFDRYGFENSTKCQGVFGPTYAAANGSRANIRIGFRDFLMQQNWVNTRKGHCALAAPEP